MRTHCPHCGRPMVAPVSGEPLICACGGLILVPAARKPSDDPARRDMRRLSRAAEQVVDLILDLGIPLIDVTIARSQLRDLAESLFPDRMDLYEMVYEARFDRLIEQWRPAGE